MIYFEANFADDIICDGINHSKMFDTQLQKQAFYERFSDSKIHKTVNSDIEGKKPGKCLIIIIFEMNVYETHKTSDKLIRF